MLYYKNEVKNREDNYNSIFGGRAKSNVGLIGTIQENNKLITIQRGKVHNEMRDKVQRMKTIKGDKVFERRKMDPLH